jgi:hypothetical protein
MAAKSAGKGGKFCGQINTICVKIKLALILKKDEPI